MTEQILFGRLSGTVAITAIVTAAKITPVRRLQDTDLPAITYEKISNVPTDTKDGVSRLDTERWTVHVFSKSYDQMNTLTELVRSALDRYSYPESGALSGVVDKFIYHGEAQLYEDWTEVHHTAIDFRVRVKR